LQTETLLVVGKGGVIRGCSWFQSSDLRNVSGTKTMKKKPPENIHPIPSNPIQSIHPVQPKIRPVPACRPWEPTMASVGLALWPSSEVVVVLDLYQKYIKNRRL